MSLLRKYLIILALLAFAGTAWASSVSVKTSGDSVIWRGGNSQEHKLQGFNPMTAKSVNVANLVSTADSQTLTNKTLINGILNGVTEVEGELDINDGIINDVGYIDFNLVDGVPASEGRFTWNDDDGTMNLGLKGGVVNLQLGQEQVIRGKNVTGVGITNCMAVRISGASGSFPEFGLANASSPATAGSIGLATENIANSQFGYITTFGLVRECDTTGTPVS